jgi:uncharacterized membrane protein
MLNIRKVSFPFSAFININEADAYNFDSVVASTSFIITSTILYNNVAWKNLQHFSGQYFG